MPLASDAMQAADLTAELVNCYYSGLAFWAVIRDVLSCSGVMDLVRPAGRALVRLGLASAGTISFALALVACGQASSQGRGTVSGIAGGCQNPLEAKLQPIVIVASQSGHVVTKAVARFEDFRSRYRLVLRPGRYTIGDPLSGASPHTVVLHPGGRINVNFPNRC